MILGISCIIHTFLKKTEDGSAAPWARSSRREHSQKSGDGSKAQEREKYMKVLFVKHCGTKAVFFFW